jgi:acyl carrier protein
MVPSTFVTVSELPLTVNGKVDLSRLPEPVFTASGYVAPRDEFEQAVVELWEGLLKRQRIGVHDNFFELGGHSLLAAQTVDLVRRKFGIEVDIRTFYGAPTPADFANAVVNQFAESADPEELARFLEG